MSKQNNSNQHQVIPDKNGGWLVKKPGLRTYGHFATQEEAIKAAKKISVEDGSQVSVKDKNGETVSDKKNKNRYVARK